MQSVSSRIWTRVAMFISYDDNQYTTGTSLVCSYQYKSNVYQYNTSLNKLQAWDIDGTTNKNSIWFL